MYEIDLNDVHIAILAGGSGTRLWPRSRRKRPKQLLNLFGQRTMIQQTADRLLPLVPPERIYVLTGPAHAEAIAEQLPEIPRENIFVEPSPKGTAPCLGLAAARLRQENSGQSVMISVHADHVIADEESFRRALVAATATARKGYLVTVGIVPTYPATGFGYIERGKLLAQEQGLDVYQVERFTEKPPLEQAREFVESGRFYWNAGYFAWTLDNILDEFQRLLPEVYARLDAMVTTNALDHEHIWGQIDPVTIDVGIMEQARNVAVVPCDMGWNDVGSWAAIYEISAQEKGGNVLLGGGTHVGLDTSSSLVYSDGRLIATIGLKDMIIIDTEDALLVVPKERAQEVNALVKELHARGLVKYL